MLELHSLRLIKKHAKQLELGFENLGNFDQRVDLDKIDSVLRDATSRLKDNYPYFHPLYAGQMIKPPHPIARLAYAIAMFINPNNHALDGGRASSAMEKEAVTEIAEMFGWKTWLGHLTSGGTMANLEALWISGCLNPGKVIIASNQAHYTHRRLTGVLQLPFEDLPVDKTGRMDMESLESRLAEGDVGTVVATLGTTATGAVDPLFEILRLQEKHDFRVHVDAAYGGYFKLVKNLQPSAQAAFDCIGRADSIVIDPHKHGLQPYGCGCIIYRDPAVGIHYKHDSPYTYFSSADLHLGEISLECSRAGASAVALWATQKLLPLEPGGEFSVDLERCCEAASVLFSRLQNDSRFLTACAPELDIVIWAPEAHLASEISRLSQRYFSAAANVGLHLALVTLPIELLQPYWPKVDFDQENVKCLRCCLLKPEHLDWIDKIWRVFDEIASGEKAV